MSTIKITLEIPEALDQQRLDRSIAQLLPDYSRSRIKQWIESGQVCINSTPITRARDKVAYNDSITVNAEILDEKPWQAQNIDLNVIHADDDIIVINKPAGLVVHPGAGNPDGTLVNALLHHFPKLATLPRAGLIHRIDKDTTGLLVIAHNISAHTQLTQAIQNKDIKRQYYAIVQGLLISGGTIDEPISRHPNARKKMSISPTGKPATTHFRLKQRFRAHTLVDIELETGRTHQIRTHFCHIGYPIIGDKTYNKKIALEAKISPKLQQALREFPRQALHAYRLTLQHPKDKKNRCFNAPVPEDMQQLIEKLSNDGNEE